MAMAVPAETQQTTAEGPPFLGAASVFLRNWLESFLPNYYDQRVDRLMDFEQTETDASETETTICCTSPQQLVFWLGATER